MFLATEFNGEFESLREFATKFATQFQGKMSMRVRLFFKIVAKLANLLRRLHETGAAHLDVNLNNFLIKAT